MRSYGGIWEKIISEENLREAWRRVRRGHASSAAVLDFEADLERNLAALRRRLLEGSYVPGGYRQFRIYDPKPRTISCAPVADRIVHHAFCGVITPLLERSFVPVSFACRKGYGAHAACALARWFGFKGILNDLASKEGSSSGSNRVKRGGSWNNNADNCTSSNRNNNNPSNENNNNDFRLVSTVSEQTGFHFDTPALRVRGDEHAPFRPASSAGNRHAGTFSTGGMISCERH